VPGRRTRHNPGCGLAARAGLRHRSPGTSAGLPSAIRCRDRQRLLPRSKRAPSAGDKSGNHHPIWTTIKSATAVGLCRALVAECHPGPLPDFAPIAESG